MSDKIIQVNPKTSPAFRVVYHNNLIFTGPVNEVQWIMQKQNQRDAKKRYDNYKVYCNICGVTEYEINTFHKTKTKPCLCDDCFKIQFENKEFRDISKVLKDIFV